MSGNKETWNASEFPEVNEKNLTPLYKKNLSLKERLAKKSEEEGKEVNVEEILSNNTVFLNNESEITPQQAEQLESHMSQVLKQFPSLTREKITEIMMNSSLTPEEKLRQLTEEEDQAHMNKLSGMINNGSNDEENDDNAMNRMLKKSSKGGKRSKHTRKSRKSRNLRKSRKYNRR